MPTGLPSLVGINGLSGPPPCERVADTTDRMARTGHSADGQAHPNEHVLPSAAVSFLLAGRVHSTQRHPSDGPVLDHRSTCLDLSYQPSAGNDDDRYGSTWPSRPYAGLSTNNFFDGQWLCLPCWPLTTLCCALSVFRDKIVLLCPFMPSCNVRTFDGLEVCCSRPVPAFDQQRASDLELHWRDWSWRPTPGCAAIPPSL